MIIHRNGGEREEDECAWAYDPKEDTLYIVPINEEGKSERAIYVRQASHLQEHFKSEGMVRGGPEIRLMIL